jgi:hypothetical protein
MTERGRPAPPGGLGALVTELIDYAGLFPPAGLGMVGAAARYRRYRGSPDAWALGRFVVPIGRLEELERAVAAADGPDPGAEPWPLTVLVTPPYVGVSQPPDNATGTSIPATARRSGRAARNSGFAMDVSLVDRFNRAHAAPGTPWRATIHSIEVKVASAGDIERASAAVPAGVEAYFEVPGDAGIDEMCRAASAAGQALKVRTGGTAPDAFPSSAVVARILAACAAARVPFKATAGLHHPVRAAHPVTYEPTAPTAAMHGFVNVFVAACLLYAGKADVGLATQVLDDELASSFGFDEDGDGLRYRDVSLPRAEVLAARRFARSFGSCSFEEPLSGLGSLFPAALRSRESFRGSEVLE